MINNILKDIFEYAKITQKELGLLLNTSQEHISDIYVKNLNNISIRELTILSLISGLDIYSLTGTKEDYILMSEELENKIIEFYQLDRDVVNKLKKRVDLVVDEVGLYSNTIINKKRKNNETIPYNKQN